MKLAFVEELTCWPNASSNTAIIYKYLYIMLYSLLQLCTRYLGGIQKLQIRPKMGQNVNHQSYLWPIKTWRKECWKLKFLLCTFWMVPFLQHQIYDIFCIFLLSLQPQNWAVTKEAYFCFSCKESKVYPAYIKASLFFACL